ncbi:hypothetical protein CKO15_09105 [Halorhodospira abdelmalekii]|uniref:DEAD/DEAH box helicase family protein n=1 Tax=Halorhodospira abdelmalekii TaxID=421629 RepID=UPI001907B2FC|nr:DEAD/DEAH box helicase family protein [Halorhodospira abdelmalekii]MBK1735437.1 hypothetical protein [Halorhodospira abdelmalekii]
MALSATSYDCLISGGDSAPLLPLLLASIRGAEEIELAVAFINASGLDLIFDSLAERCDGARPAQIRILTSDYLGITDPRALRQLLLLQERGANIRVYETNKRSFHLKAYIFTRASGTEGEAFIGSSNISAQALTRGIEWNYRIVQGSESNTNQLRLNEIRQAFFELFQDEHSRELDHNWIDEYEHRRTTLLIPGITDDYEPTPPPPTPNQPQQEALIALNESRKAGYKRGLVVMATGLGKTYLAAFDAAQSSAERILFIAHREEILLQAESSFQRVFPSTHIGRYRSNQRDTEKKIIFASIQTLHREKNLQTFKPGHFDYIVVDEFHHATASSYRRALQYFQPNFLLGLTATPERSDHSDILSLCDNNLVYTFDLFHGIRNQHLCPFHYFGIHDEHVEYTKIPWRSGKFDDKELTKSLATRARAKHNIHEWKEKAGQRTLAFCASKAHADFMARQFNQNGAIAVSVHSTSETYRSEAIEKIEKGEVQVICSVDLFNEGVDIPAIDTIMMLRPTESPTLFLQQLGRGLRHHPDKTHLTVIDFIGNHRSFLNRPQALFKIQNTNSGLQRFIEQAATKNLHLPDGCFVNFDVEFIDFMAALRPTSAEEEFHNLKAALGRRPTAAEAYRSGVALPKLRTKSGSWHRFLLAESQLDPLESRSVEAHGDFLQEVEKTTMTKSFKMILLEAFLELDGFKQGASLLELSKKSFGIIQRRRELIIDMPEKMRDPKRTTPEQMLSYWMENPINAWAEKNKKRDQKTWFHVSGDFFSAAFRPDNAEIETLTQLTQELIEYKIAAYQERATFKSPKDKKEQPKKQDNVAYLTAVKEENQRPLKKKPAAAETNQEKHHNETYLPYFPDLKIACGHFRSGHSETAEDFRVPPGHGRLNSSRHFIAPAHGNSMNGGKNPIRDGDYLILEYIAEGSAGSITGQTLAIERQNIAGDNEYLLRSVIKDPEGKYILRAQNPDYTDLVADDNMWTFARLRGIIHKT